MGWGTSTIRKKGKEFLEKDRWEHESNYCYYATTAAERSTRLGKQYYKARLWGDGIGDKKGLNALIYRVSMVH